MRTQDDYDVHADLRQKVAELGRHLIEIEARVWQLKDAFYAHTHPAADDGDEDDGEPYNPREEDEDR